MADARPAQRAGITLAELLVVLAVIGALAALLVPAGLAVRRFAVRTACSANLRTVGLACQAYALDWDGRIPAERTFGIDDPARSPAWYHRLPAYTGDEVKHRSAYQCPGFRRNGPMVFTDAVPKSFKMNSYLDDDGRPRNYRLAGRTADRELVLFVDARAGETGVGQWGYTTPSSVTDERHRGAANALAADGTTLLRLPRPKDGDWATAARWRHDDW